MLVYSQKRPFGNNLQSHNLYYALTGTLGCKPHFGLNSLIISHKTPWYLYVIANPLRPGQCCTWSIMHLV